MPLTLYMNQLILDMNVRKLLFYFGGYIMNFSKVFRTLLVSLLLVSVPMQVVAMGRRGARNNQRPAQAQQDQNQPGNSVSNFFNKAFGEKSEQQKVLTVAILLTGFAALMNTSVARDAISSLWNKFIKAGINQVNKGVFKTWDTMLGGIEVDTNNDDQQDGGQDEEVDDLI